MIRIDKAGYQGFYLPDFGIAMDGVHPDAQFTFVTHAHADHMHRDARVTTFATAPTLALMKLRGFRGRGVTLAFGQAVSSEELWDRADALEADVREADAQVANALDAQEMDAQKANGDERTEADAQKANGDERTKANRVSEAKTINPKKGAGNHGAPGRAFRVTLYPAGHILGSAMIYIESDLGSLLYTGDCRTPPSPATEGFFAPPAGTVDTLITEATFALPIYRWEPHEKLADQVRDFAVGALQQRTTPVFLAYNLGKAQEIMHMLAPLELDEPVMIHGAGYPLCGVYEQFGVPLGRYEPYERASCEGRVLISPSSALGTGFASNVKRKKIAYCSGWATLEARQSQLNADELIPLSDHLDFYALLAFVEGLAPKRTIITHSPNAAVVLHYLRARGLVAEAG